jgi:hypothetical protein
MDLSDGSRALIPMTPAPSSLAATPPDPWAVAPLPPPPTRARRADDPRAYRPPARASRVDAQSLEDEAKPSPRRLPPRVPLPMPRHARRSLVGFKNRHTQQRRGCCWRANAWQKREARIRGRGAAGRRVRVGSPIHRERSVKNMWSVGQIKTVRGDFIDSPGSTEISGSGCRVTPTHQSCSSLTRRRDSSQFQGIDPRRVRNPGTIPIARKLSRRGSGGIAF